MPRKKKSNKVASSQIDSLLDECQQNADDSSSWLETRRDEWDDLESMLIVKLEDDMSKTTKSILSFSSL